MMSDAEPGALSELTDIGLALNVGKLEKGAVVDALVDNRIQLAEIINVLNDDTYEVSLWNIVSKVGSVYQEGFHTRDRIIREIKRSHLFVKGIKCRQSVSEEVVTFTCR